MKEILKVHKDTISLILVSLLFISGMMTLGKMQAPREEAEKNSNASDIESSKSISERMFLKDWPEHHQAGLKYGMAEYKLVLTSIMSKTKQAKNEIAGATIEGQKLILKECNRKYTLLHILQQANIALDGYPDATGRYTEVVFALAMLDCPENFR